MSTGGTLLLLEEIVRELEKESRDQRAPAVAAAVNAVARSFDRVLKKQYT